MVYTNLCISLILMYVLVLIKSDDTAKPHEKFAKIEEPGLKEGDCGKAQLADLIFHDRVQKPAIPFIERNATSNWHGDFKIYCVIAEPHKDTKPGASVNIKDGGINHTFVTIEIHSQQSEGLDYSIQVFGKKV